MTRKVILTCLTLFVYLLQVTMVPQILLYRFRLDLLLLWVVSYALLTGPKEGLRFGLMVGLLLDLTIGNPFGLQMLCKGLIGYLAGNLAHTFFREQLRLPLLIIFTALLGQELMLFAFNRSMLGSRVAIDESAVSEFILMIIYSLCFAAWIYRYLAQLVDWLERTAIERSDRK